MEQRDSFVFYRSFRDAFAELRPNDRLVIYEAIANYALDGVEPDLRGVTRGYWQLIRPQIDANYKRFQSGRRGGRPRKPRPSEETEKAETVGFESWKPTDTGSSGEQKTDGSAPEKPNVNVNVNGNVNANVNENENGAAFPPGRYRPPTAEAVRAYVRDNGLRVDVERYMGYYRARNWRTANGKPVDWQARLRQWDDGPGERASGRSEEEQAADNRRGVEQMKQLLRRMQEDKEDEHNG